MFFGFRDVNWSSPCSGHHRSADEPRTSDPGGLAADLPDAARPGPPAARSCCPAGGELEDLLRENAIWKARTGIGYLDSHRLHGARDHRTGAAFHRTATRSAQDPTYCCGYQVTTSNVITGENSDCYDRYVIRVEEIDQSRAWCRGQLPGTAGTGPGDDRGQNWPGRRISTGSRRSGQQPAHRQDHGRRWRPLIHLQDRHRGIRVPAGCYVAVESPRGAGRA